MKVRKYEATALYADGVMTANILRAIEEAVCTHEYLLKKGWRLIVKTQSPSGRYHLDVQSNRGGGSFAEVKMKTLEDYSGKCCTGTDEISYITEVIQMAGLENEKTAQEIIGLDQSSHLTRIHHEWLRDCIGYTNFYGAIKVPFAELTPRCGAEFGDEPDSGNIKVAFSGATAEQDLFFATLIFAHMQQNLNKLCSSSQFWYNLRALREVPNVNFWLTMLNIPEAPQ